MPKINIVALYYSFAAEKAINTSQCDAFQILDFSSFGFKAYMNKPFMIGDLDDKLKALLE